MEAVRRALENGEPDALTVDRLAEAAAVHRSTIYRRWPTTGALVAELLRSLTPVEPPLPDTGSLADDLQSLARRVATTIEQPLIEPSLRLAASSSDPDLVDAASRYWSGVLDHAAEVVRRAQARGEARTEIEPTEAIESLLGPIYLRLLVTRQPVLPRDVRRLAARSAAMLAP